MDKNRNFGPEVKKLVEDLHKFIQTYKDKGHPSLQQGARSHFVSRKTSWGLEILAHDEGEDTHVEMSINPRELRKWFKEAGVGDTLGLSFKGIWLMWKASMSKEQPGNLAIFLDNKNPKPENIILLCKGDTPVGAIEKSLELINENKESPEKLAPCAKLVEFKVESSGEIKCVV